MAAASLLQGRPVVGLLCQFDEQTSQRLAASYELVSKTDAGWPQSHDAGIVRGLATRGDIGADRATIDALPNLEIIVCYGVGFDAIDLDAAAARNIRVTNTPDVLTEDVADMGLGLALAITRRLPVGDVHVRSGNWARAPFPLVRRFYGCKVGIVGYGRVGQSVARRLTGFGCEIAYFDVRKNAQSPHQWFQSLPAMARWADMLIVTVAGGASTTRLIDGAILAELGPAGYLVNISRGSVVDEAALLAALERGGIAGAALDVFWNEPNVDSRFLRLENVVLQPHHASATVETRRAMGALMCDILDAHFEGAALPTPVR
jgi:D-3-phosphoglycerate dehydrogenase